MAQRYEPLGDGRVRYSDEDLVRDLTVGPDGFVTHYPDLGELVQGVAWGYPRPPWPRSAPTTSPPSGAR